MLERFRWVVLLLIAACVAGKDNSTDSKALAKDVLHHAREQYRKLPPSNKVFSHLVKEASEAELKNGDADVNAAEICEPDIDAFCVDVPPGEGRLANCLRKRIKNEEEGNVTGRRVSKPCKKEVADFFEDRSKNINKHLQLAAACTEDATKFCKSEHTAEEGAVIGCLRKNKKKLKSKCQELVFDMMLAAAYDYHADAELSKACSEDAERECKDVPNGQGRIQECLRGKAANISPKCAKEIFRQEMENSDDIRLSLKLHKFCEGDQQRFCKNIKYGSNRIKDCLEKNRKKPKFSTECRKELEAVMESRSKDFRLDPELKESCASDIQDICQYDAEGVVGDPDVHEARVIMCLTDFVEDLNSPACKKSVQHIIQLSAEDFRFNEPLVNSCFEDRKSFCANIQPGSARVIKCLQDAREQLSSDCRAAVFDHEQRIAEAIDYQVPLLEACSEELTEICQNERKGHGRIVRCLQKHANSNQVGAQCRKEIRRNMNRMSQDYRLNTRLRKACSADTTALCDGVCPDSNVACGGTVLRCLQDQIEHITATECRDEVFYFVQMEVSDYRNDVLLAEACRSDVDSYCQAERKNLKQGAMLECLQRNRAKLSPGCKKEEGIISALQAHDVRLRPRIMSLCTEEMVSFCGTVKPGGGRMFQCLLENVLKPTFNSECKAEILKREHLAKEDYRMDAGVSESCRSDVQQYCSEAASVQDRHGEVLLCMVDQMMDRTGGLSGECEKHLSRAVRMGFWDYQKGSSLTQLCDADVEKICTDTNRMKGVFSIGYIGKCLSKQVASQKPLSAGCRKLVTAAAPSDVRMYLQGTMNPDGSLKSDNTMFQNAVESASFITLHGWIAFLSVLSSVFVVGAGAYWLLRRASGLDRPHTTIVRKAQFPADGEL